LRREEEKKQGEEGSLRQEGKFEGEAGLFVTKTANTERSVSSVMS
jgi:hypothetical protein